MIKTPASVLIIGAGLAGLTAARRLSKLGYRITILDDGSERRDSVSHPPNTPSFVLGCHQRTLDLLQCLHRTGEPISGPTVNLEFRLPEGMAVYRRSRLPMPLHPVASLIRFQGLAGKDRWKLLSYLERLWEGELTVPADLENRLAAEWLGWIGQSQNALEQIWQPLAQWLTGNPLSRLSAAVFAQTMSKMFLARSSASTITQLSGDSLLSDHRVTLLDRLTNPLTEELRASGASIGLSSQRDRLLFDQDNVAGLRLSDGRTVEAEWYICALPRRALLSLLPERLLTRFAYFSQIGELTDLAGLTIQATCRLSISRPRLILLSGSSFSELSLTPLGLDTSSVLLSAIDNPSLQASSDAELMDLARSELRRGYPDLADDRVRSIHIVRDGQAALSLHPGAALLRPIQTSPIANLLLGGAWTDTGWPPNLESEIVSGERCAEHIAKQAESSD